MHSYVAVSLQCLKESYVKALGVGIGFNLQRIDFRIYSELERGHYTTDTRVYVDDVALEQWRFEETLLDDRHCVATALCIEVRQRSIIHISMSYVVIIDILCYYSIKCTATFSELPLFWTYALCAVKSLRNFC